MPLLPEDRAFEAAQEFNRWQARSHRRMMVLTAVVAAACGVGAVALVLWWRGIEAAGGVVLAGFFLVTTSLCLVAGLAIARAVLRSLAEDRSVELAERYGVKRQQVTELAIPFDSASKVKTTRLPIALMVLVQLACVPVLAFAPSDSPPFVVAGLLVGTGLMLALRRFLQSPW